MYKMIFATMGVFSFIVSQTIAMEQNSGIDHPVPILQEKFNEIFKEEITTLAQLNPQQRDQLFKEICEEYDGLHGSQSILSALQEEVGQREQDVNKGGSINNGENITFYNKLQNNLDHPSVEHFRFYSPKVETTDAELFNALQMHFDVILNDALTAIKDENEQKCKELNGEFYNFATLNSNLLKKYKMDMTWTY